MLSHLFCLPNTLVRLLGYFQPASISFDALFVESYLPSTLFRNKVPGGPSSLGNLFVCFFYLPLVLF